MEKMTKKAAYISAIDALSTLENYNEVIEVLRKEVDNLDRKAARARATRAVKTNSNNTDVRNSIVSIISTSDHAMTASEVFDLYVAQNPEKETTVRKIQYQLTQLAKDNIIHKEKVAKVMTYSYPATEATEEDEEA